MIPIGKNFKSQNRVITITSELESKTGPSHRVRQRIGKCTKNFHPEVQESVQARSRFLVLFGQGQHRISRLQGKFPVDYVRDASLTMGPMHTPGVYYW